jgi:hypothetical protein
MHQIVPLLAEEPIIHRNRDGCRVIDDEMKIWRGIGSEQAIQYMAPSFVRTKKTSRDRPTHVYGDS